MLTLRNQQPSLRDKVLPQELLELPEELKVVDKILDDPRFFKPFLERFDTRMGRPAKAVEMYIRMMYLKFRYNLGYGTLVREVSDSIKWRQLCRIPLDGKVPDRSTLIKSTKRYGPEVVDELNKLLLVPHTAFKYGGTTKNENRGSKGILPLNWLQKVGSSWCQEPVS